MTLPEAVKLLEEMRREWGVELDEAHEDNDRAYARRVKTWREAIRIVLAELPLTSRSGGTTK